jgi:hypothetical protein
LHESPGKGHNVFASLSQRWNLDVGCIQQVEKIFTKRSIPNGFLQIACGGSNYAHIHTTSPGFSNPFERFLLQQAK